MKLERIPHEPGALLNLYEEGLSALGALCERTWHDRLEVIAEGKAARLWREDGALHEVELRFAAADASLARDAGREVFPGCPLTFRLAESLRPSPLPLERFVLSEAAPHLASAAVMEKLWRAQFPDTTRWQLASPPSPVFHYSLLALARCEIQAHDQHWSLHRTALSLMDGAPDESLARDIMFEQAQAQTETDVAWPKPEPGRWRRLFQQALQREMDAEITLVLNRQEKSLRRELERIDDYFKSYEQELTARAQRSSRENSKIKMSDRLAAAKAEHERRRHDQIARHEIRVLPHLDALLIVAEKAWRASLDLSRTPQTRTINALFVPRLRLWKLIPVTELQTETAGT
jgi:hypothetical protein